MTTGSGELLSKRSEELPTFKVLNAKINAVNYRITLALIDEWVRTRHRDYIVLTNVEGIVEMQKNRRLLEINNRSGLTVPDGMPVVWLGRLKGFSEIEKVTSQILPRTLANSIEKGYRHFFYGGAEGVAEQLANRMSEYCPGVRIVGTFCPPFRELTSEEVWYVAETINRSVPDIVWVGTGCPKQEFWMAGFRPLLTAPVLIGVGAAFDFFSGRRPVAPEWVSQTGFEWLFRLVCEPRRLWKRYAKAVPLFPAYLLKQHLKIGAKAQATKPLSRYRR